MSVWLDNLAPLRRSVPAGPFRNAPSSNFWFFPVHMAVQNPIGIALAAILSSPRLRLAARHRSAIFVHARSSDRVIEMAGAPGGHQALCDAKQAWIVDAILHDRDLTCRMADAVQPLRICLAADESIRAGRMIDLRRAE